MMASEITTANYHSPIGEIFYAIREGNVVGLWFEGQKYFGSTLKLIRGVLKGTNLDQAPESAENSATESVLIDWLNSYFQSGGEPKAPLPPIELIGTEFQKRVWRRLLEIPHGTTVTYGEIARELGSSARAVGGAVGRNPLLLLVPCHRVIATDGSIGGFAAGEAVKRWLLSHERSIH